MIGRNISTRATQQGLSLIELMIALVLGLLISGATLMVFQGNRQTARATESQSRIQENMRTGFELMARDLREAGGNACESGLSMINVLKTPAAQWWSNTDTSFIGYDGATAMSGLTTGTAAGNRVAGTEALEIKSAFGNSIGVTSHAPGTAAITLRTASHGFVAGDIVAACDFNHVSVFQVTAVSGAVISHTATGANPGNAKSCLSFDGTCGSGIKVTYAFGCRFGESPCVGTTWPATVTKLRPTRWYVGINPRGGRSLYQSIVNTVAGVPTVSNQEVVEGVRELSMEYLVSGAGGYVATSAMTAANWPSVTAVRVRMVIQGEDRVGTDGQPLQQTLVHTVAIRNKAP